MSFYLGTLLADGFVYFVVSIWLLVRAFRVSILWGLIAMFVPLGRFVFAFVHWSEGARLLFIQVATIGVAATLIFATPLRDEFKNERGHQRAESAQTDSDRPAPREARDLAEPTATPATRPADPRAAYAAHARELNEIYQQLAAEWPKLKRGSPAVAFSSKAARYQEGLHALADEKARLDALDGKETSPKN